MTDNLVAILAFIVAIVTPLVVLLVYSAIGLAIAYLIFLAVTYRVEWYLLDEKRKNKKLLNQIRSGKI